MLPRKSFAKVVRLSEIKTDPDVNRPLDRNWVNYLVKNWNQSLMGIPVVAALADRFVVIDGQHRLEALREMHAEDIRVNVLVLEGMSKPEMAGAFVEFNHTRNVRPFDKFVKLVYSGDTDACAIASQLTKRGLHLATSSMPGSVACVSQLQSVFAIDHTGEILGWTLDVLSAAWGTDATAYNAAIVGGLALLLHSFPTVETKPIVRCLASTPGGPSGVVGKGRTLKDIQGGTVAGGVAEHMRHLYNKGRRTKRLEAA